MDHDSMSILKHAILELGTGSSSGVLFHSFEENIILSTVRLLQVEFEASRRESLPNEGGAASARFDGSVIALRGKR